MTDDRFFIFQWLVHEHFLYLSVHWTRELTVCEDIIYGTSAFLQDWSITYISCFLCSTALVYNRMVITVKEDRKYLRIKTMNKNKDETTNQEIGYPVSFYLLPLAHMKISLEAVEQWIRNNFPFLCYLRFTNLSWHVFWEAILIE